jgi:anti-sigma B factor antagonist
MEISRSQVESAAVIHCEGRLNMVAAPRLRSVIEAAVDEGRPRVVIDLGGTTFVDSSGLGALVAGLKKARQSGGDLRIAGAGEQVRTVLGLTNLDRVLRPHERVEDALDGW